MIGLELSPSSKVRGQEAPLAAFFARGGGESVALAEATDGGLSIWTEIAPNYAACLHLDNTNAANRLSWRETLVMELRNIYPIAELSLTGAWSQLQSSGSGLSGSYTGNRAISTSSAAASADVMVDRADPYDVWIHFTGRTNGGYCRVDIDAAQTLVNEISDPDGLGFKAFSTYTAVDLQRRQSAKVASGLTGSHAVTVTHAGTATPGGNAIIIEAVSITGSLSDPRILPPLWQPNTPYAMGDEVQYGGLYYAARATGDSGTAGPVHTGGIASDGALDWRADDRSTYPRFVAIDYASEREYAARFAVDGAATELGGQTHGNEALLTRVIRLDDAEWVPSTVGNGLSLGQSVRIVEETVWQQQTGGDVADAQLTRVVTPGAIDHTVRVVGSGAGADFEWLYVGMVPMVRWDGESASTVVDSVTPANTAPVALGDYAGTHPENIDFIGVNRIGIRADIAGAALLYGHEAGVTQVSGNLLTQCDSFLLPNLDASEASGSLDWKAKAYVSAHLDDAVVLGAGDVMGFYSRHVLHVDPSLL